MDGNSGQSGSVRHTRHERGVCSWFGRTERYQGELFYLLQIEKVSDLVKLRMDLNTAIGVLSQNEKALKDNSVINTLNKLMAGLMQYDSDHYGAMDTVLGDALEKLKNK